MTTAFAPTSRTISDRHRAHDHRAGSYHDVVAQDGHAGPCRVLTDGHVLEQRAAVAEYDTGVDDDAVRMREEQLRSEATTAEVGAQREAYDVPGGSDRTVAESGSRRLRSCERQQPANGPAIPPVGVDSPPLGGDETATGEEPVGDCLATRLVIHAREPTLT